MGKSKKTPVTVIESAILTYANAYSSQSLISILLNKECADFKARISGFSLQQYLEYGLGEKVTYEVIDGNVYFFKCNIRIFVLTSEDINYQIRRLAEESYILRMFAINLITFIDRITSNIQKSGTSDQVHGNVQVTLTVA